MFNYKFIKEKLNCLVSKVKQNLTKKDIDFIEEEIAYGEELLALEVLCEQLAEYNAPLSKEVYEDFEEIGKILNIEEEHLSYVKKLIINPS